MLTQSLTLFMVVAAYVLSIFLRRREEPSTSRAVEGFRKLYGSAPLTKLKRQPDTLDFSAARNLFGRSAFNYTG